MRRLRLAALRLAALLLAASAACAAPRPPALRYRGPDGGVEPVFVEPLAEGRVSWEVDAVLLRDGEASVRRTLRSRADAPVRVELGRLRLRAASGAELRLVRICAHPLVVASVLGEAAPAPERARRGGVAEALGTERCIDAETARGRLYVLSPGESVPLRADFASPAAATAADPELARLVLADDGVLVGGRRAPVEVPLELVRPPAR